MCYNIKRGNTCRYGNDCIFRHFSDPPTKGDAKAISLGAPQYVQTCMYIHRVLLIKVVQMSASTTKSLRKTLIVYWRL